MIDSDGGTAVRSIAKKSAIDGTNNARNPDLKTSHFPVKQNCVLMFYMSHYWSATGSMRTASLMFLSPPHAACVQCERT